jgi:uncharacterized protein YukE
MMLQFLRSEVSNVIAGVGQQQQIVSGVMDQIKSFVPKVQSSWIGGDADEFASDVARKVIPAITELIAAIGGINLNLNKATSAVDAGDAKAKGMVSQLADLFGQI